ncbi:M10 family metallopeptidase C-terminal domain-containing protein [Tropicimonas marinistellae]|uniref:M10 family metallopeptidase C-terminal domain-containing protein n=1 Tax=Tropicimonas marinistellae TaxID=1739787 RepID=UPI000832BF54|nr:M10 family metallopeptidase C-terminal domain-containing protein [Tropicimonas marinistellae]
MAFFKAYTPIDMINQDVWEGKITVANVNRITQEEIGGERKISYFGEFQYDNPDPPYLSGGTLNGIKHWSGSKLDFEMSGAEADMISVYLAILSDDLKGAQSALLAKADKIIGSGGDDKLYGFDGNDKLKGQGGADVLFGQTGRDAMYGGRGNDALKGGAGNDKLIGGAGIDELTGGKGADSFIYKTAADTPKKGDQILDFGVGNDVIDLSAIDAKSGRGNQSFSFEGETGFSGAKGELVYKLKGDAAIVKGDIDGDGLADFKINVFGDTSLTADDFIL